MLQSILLPFLMRCCCWPLIHWNVYPWSSKEFWKKKNCGSAPSILLWFTSPLDIITIVRFLDVLMVSHSAELRSFSLTTCILHPQSTTNSLPSSSLVDAANSTFSSAKILECSLVFFVELVSVLRKIPSIASGTSLLSFRHFMGPLFKFQCIHFANEEL